MTEWCASEGHLRGLRGVEEDEINASKSESALGLDYRLALAIQYSLSKKKFIVFTAYPCIQIWRK